MKFLEDLPACEPPLWGRGGHTQTLLGYLLPSPSLEDTGERWAVELGDGDQLIGRIHETAGARVVHLLFHGLAGDTESAYIRRSVQLARKMGATAVRMNLRSAGEGIDAAKSFYHAGRASDVGVVIRAARSRWPEARVIVSGFSMSGNILLNLLGRGSAEDLPDGAFVVNPSINLQATSVRLERGLNRLYDWRFIRDLLAMLERKRALGMSIPEMERVPRTVFEFDEMLTCRVAGFRDARHYYRECSSAPHVGAIRTPTLVLTASEDPFVPVEDFQSAPWSDTVRLRIERHGGHLGYLSRGRLRWLDQATESAWVSLLRDLR